MVKDTITPYSQKNLFVNTYFYGMCMFQYCYKVLVLVQMLVFIDIFHYFY